LEKQFECRYETLEFKKGITHMDGETALKFIRSRHSEEHGNDFARGERTQAVLTAIKNKLLSLEIVENVDEFYAEFSQMISTDINEDKILEIITKVGNVSDYSYNKLQITKDNLLDSSTSSDGQKHLERQAVLYLSLLEQKSTPAILQSILYYS